MRKQYISSLKGIACLFVALGHFLGVVKYASSIPLNITFFSWLEKYRLGFMLDESFWLYLFFIVSGYLVANSKVTTIAHFFVRAIIRFLRLAIPIFAACSIIFVFNRFVPYYNAQTSVFFENAWLQNAYATEFSVGKLLLSPFDVLFLNRTIFNSPYWVLRSMMFASFLIYILTYIKHKDNSQKVFWILAVLLSLSSLYFDRTIFVCIIGAFICYYEASLQKLFQSKMIRIGSGLVSIALCFLHGTVGAIAVFSWMMIAIPKLLRVKSFLEKKVFSFVGEISFGIYSFHWPIFCSCGALIIIKLWNVLGGGYAILLSIALSAIATILISVFFYYVVEKPANKLIKMLKDKSEKLLSKPVK
ncbi:MAG: acyltransferase [Ruminococcaceae bacterium]|nr:acyltransferase [Oscillospiraceae bacterium]